MRTPTTSSNDIPIPPPTSNSLPHEERTRLIRSTRKLGSLLGTTPKLLDPSSSSSNEPSSSRPTLLTRRSLRRDIQSVSSIDVIRVVPAGPGVYLPSLGKRFDYDPISSTASEPPATTSHVEKKFRSSPRPLAQPTLLRLRSVPVLKPDDATTTTTSASSASANPKRLSLTPSLASTTSSNPHHRPTTPLSPTFSINMEEKQAEKAIENKDRDRRRKMAKLTRTLGENIPPELVFGVTPSTSAAATTTTTTIGRSSTISGFHSSPRHSFSTANSSSDGHSRSSSTKRKDRPRSLTLSKIPPVRTKQKTSYEDDDDTTPTALVPKTATQASMVFAGKKKSMDSQHQQPSEPPPPYLSSDPYSSYNNIASSSTSTSRRSRSISHTSLAFTEQQQQRHRVSSSSEAAAADSDLESADPRWGKRKEKGWSGEWNRQDLGDVMSALRGLKAR